MDYKNLSADINMILPRHFTSGRSARIDRVILHHNAGVLDARGVYSVWLTREASAHYQVDTKGAVSQHVWDKDTAWHCSGQNARSIGIEHSNSGGAAQGWPIAPATRRAGARLTAAICKYYGLGRPQYGKNVFVHRDFNSTECPARLRTEYLAEYMREAQAFYDSGLGSATTTSGSTSTTASTIEETINSMKATHVIFQHGGALYMANILSGTYSLIPNPQTLNNMITVLARVGAKCVEWKHFTTSKSNNADPAAFGIEIKKGN